jgi:hypothetical protein
LRISTKLKGLVFLALKGLVLVGLWLALKINFIKIIQRKYLELLRAYF